MPIIFVIFALFFVLSAISLRAALENGDRKYTIFFCSCLLLSLLTLVLHSMGLHVLGPTEMIIKIAEILMPAKS